VLAAGLAWSRRGLVLATGGSTLIALLNFPDGSIGLYKAFYLAAVLAAACLAAVSLVRPDPLRLSAWWSGRADTPPDHDGDYAARQAAGTRPPFGGLRAGGH
jgi:alpha-1,6-mannosyltransferase